MPIQSTPDGRKEIIPFQFRFPVRQAGEREIEMLVPRGMDGVPVLNDVFVEQHRLSEAEIACAESEVLRSIAIIR